MIRCSSGRLTHRFPTIGFPPSSTMRRMTFVVGDTIGHVKPALAVAEAWRERHGDVDALFLAADRTPEVLVTQAGWAFDVVPASAIRRVGVLGKVAAVARVLAAIPGARTRLADHGSRVVIGSGGYASGSVLLAARSLGLHTALIEPNATPGLANTLLRPIARRVYLSLPDAGERFTPAQRLVVGTPVAPTLASRLTAIDRHRAHGVRARVFVTGGSRGEHFLAAQVPALMGALRERGLDVVVRHQIGRAAPEPIAAAYATVAVEAELRPFVGDMAGSYVWADLIIARPGASTLAELALAGLPSLLVPLADAAANHQADNARAFAATGAARWVSERDWDVTRLAGELVAVLEPAAWQAMSAAARAQATPGAAWRIVEDCEAMMRGRW